MSDQEPREGHRKATDKPEVEGFAASRITRATDQPDERRYATDEPEVEGFAASRITRATSDEDGPGESHKH